MLTIREAQLQVLEDDRRRRFENELVTRLRAHFPAEAARLLASTEDDLPLREVVRAAEQLGTESGIASDRGIEALAEVMFCRGVDFFERRELAWTKRLLFESARPGDARALVIRDSLLGVTEER